MSLKYKDLTDRNTGILCEVFSRINYYGFYALSI